jgi:hypothetical protein
MIRIVWTLTRIWFAPIASQTRRETWPGRPMCTTAQTGERYSVTITWKSNAVPDAGRRLVDVPQKKASRNASSAAR